MFDSLETNLVDLSIAIVSWNTVELLDQCLASVPAGIGDLQAEIIVVDNASTDGTVEMLRDKYPTVRLLANTDNVGFARANNQAYRISAGEFVVLLNPDTIVHEGAIASLVDYLREHGECGVAAPKLLWEDGSPQPSVGCFFSLSSELRNALCLSRIGRKSRPSQMIVPPGDQPVDVEWACGACLVVRRDAIGSTKYVLDERYFIFSEEADMCKSMAENGWKVCFVPDAFVTHFGSASTSQVRVEMLARLYESKFLFFAKHNGPVAANVYRLGILPVHTLVRILGYGPALVVGARIGEKGHVNPGAQSRLLWDALGWRSPSNKIGAGER